MNVNVSTDALEFVSAIYHQCGLPTPQDPDANEVFGEYLIPGASGLLVYEADAQAWSSWQRSINSHVLAGEWLDEEEMQVLFLMEDLNIYQPDDFPDDLTHTTTNPPFAYQGWRFAWTFFPALKRWEIAPWGRA